MPVVKKPFGAGASLYTLENARGMQAVVSDFGAVLVALKAPDKNGELVDVVCGYDDIEKYCDNPQYQGQVVGRYANRIGGAKFTLNGKEYKLDSNEGENVLHGGYKPYGTRLWQVVGQGDASVTFALSSPDGDQGMPGNAEITVEYSLTGDALQIQYRAVADKDTYFNLTNHAYFNLGGHGSGSTEGQYMQLHCSRFTPIDKDFIPTGEIWPVQGTPMDFTSPKPLGRDADAQDYEQIALGNGYDHNFVLDEPGLHKPFVRCWSEQTGILMQGYTDLPGVQVYGGNNMGAIKGGKNGADYLYRGGFCLETQFFPDTPNKPEFPTCLYKAGKAFESTTVYQFSHVEQA